jgi:hypothetical protein
MIIFLIKFIQAREIGKRTDVILIIVPMKPITDTPHDTTGVGALTPHLRGRAAKSHPVGVAPGAVVGHSKPRKIQPFA